MSESIRKRKDLDYREKIQRIIVLSVTSGIVLILTIFNYFVPYYTFLPAEKIAMRADGELRMHFLSIGQGDVTIIEFPEGDCLVVDAGDGSYKSNNKLFQYVKGLNASKLSFVVTHADIDHYGGAEILLDRFEIQTLYLPVLESENATYRRMLQAAESNGCETATLSRYDVIASSSGAYIVCISPYSVEETDTNDASAVLYLRYGDTAALLCSDISSVRERRILREYAVDETLFDSGTYKVRLEETDILKVSHHGSAASSCEAWLSMLSPAVAVISCGQDNNYGHPAAETLARLADSVEGIYRTDELGDIVITITQTDYSVFYG